MSLVTLALLLAFLLCTVSYCFLIKTLTQFSCISVALCPIGALGGRLDHTLSNLNTLYCYRHLNMALWGDGNLVRLLRAGTARIQPARAEGPTCGLVPLARPATASSNGLKWDLDNTHVS